MLRGIMEWLILLLLVPAIVVPVVLFFGFAGCSFHAPPGPVFISSIEPIALNTLMVKWTDTEPRGIGFEIYRTKVSNQTSTVRKVAASLREITDDGLEPATQYSYQVRRILHEGEPPLEEDLSAPVTGTTLGPAFLQALPQSAEGLQGFTFVQRIEPVRLLAGGNRVAITIRSASAVSMKIAKLYISQAVPDPVNTYDSATDLTKVVDDPMNPISVPLGTAKTLPVIDYKLDPDKPLLVAFEFVDATEEGGNFGRVTGVPATEATVYRSPAGAVEAHKHDRETGYTPIDNIYLIERIDVAEVPG